MTNHWLGILLTFSLAFIINLVSTKSDNTNEDDQSRSSVIAGVDASENGVHFTDADPRRAKRTVDDVEYGAEYDTYDDDAYDATYEASQNGRRHGHRHGSDGQPERSRSDSSDYVEYGSTGGHQENCSLCAMRDIRNATKLHRIQTIKYEILKKLKLDSPPNITDKRVPDIPIIKEWMKDLGYEDPNNDQSPSSESDHPTVRIMSMINMAKPPPEDKRLPDMENVCYFEFQPDVAPDDIVSARLGVFLRPVTVSTDTITMFLIYKVKPRRRGNIIVRRKRVILNADSTNKWHTFSVAPLVRSWVRNPSTNYGLQILIYDEAGQSLAIVDPQNNQEELYSPYVEMELLKKVGGSRDKRDFNCADELSPRAECCRYPLTLNFYEIGWDFIVVPKIFDAYYCAGKCELTSYSHVVNQSLNKTGSSTETCCVPKEHGMLRMVYYTNTSNIMYGTLPGILVDRCGCS